MEANDAVESVTERVIGCAIAVHTALGPGLLESIYRDCLLIEMKEAGLVVETERVVTLEYKDSESAGTSRSTFWFRDASLSN